ncbi:hypothetical protein TvY486_0031890 [Trypanosoma vivax Y486]|uniref:Uncharacterized protein n=1 Tax=Trypanosoma vivax (strain Y486) TaxID=1055687 RepID=F9WS53_TRYVY|nr:hypothetical protein TvY486_0031890 [Trypanosoma vivax Y486]|eukprot:CCD20391.1 hypothetical protein TvY486_0031890 [Trypanosoma vivax Y486]
MSAILADPHPSCGPSHRLARRAFPASFFFALLSLASNSLRSMHSPSSRRGTCPASCVVFCAASSPCSVATSTLRAISVVINSGQGATLRGARSPASGCWSFIGPAVVRRAMTARSYGAACPCVRVAALPVSGDRRLRVPLPVNVARVWTAGGGARGETAVASTGRSLVLPPRTLTRPRCSPPRSAPARPRLLTSFSRQAQNLRTQGLRWRRGLAQSELERLSAGRLRNVPVKPYRWRVRLIVAMGPWEHVRRPTRPVACGLWPRRMKAALPRTGPAEIAHAAQWCFVLAGDKESAQTHARARCGAKEACSPSDRADALGQSGWLAKEEGGGDHAADVRGTEKHARPSERQREEGGKHKHEAERERNDTGDHTEALSTRAARHQPGEAGDAEGGEPDVLMPANTGML